MGLETPVPGGLVLRAGAARVYLAQNSSSHCSILPLQKAIGFLYLNTTVILSRLDLGEQAAIALAQQLNADFLIIDERLGRRFAQQRGLQVIGILGILTEAAKLGLIDLSTAIDRLQQTNFRVSQRLIQNLLQPSEDFLD